MSVTITPQLYLANCKRRFGVANPERVDSPVWEWMVREDHNPYSARKALGLEPDFGSCELERNPDWCFQRMGAAAVTLPDGRELSIAGEHEDWYDPDFCIYNDLVVKRGDDVEIYSYPREVFPPTDFHTATVIGKTVWLVGSLGYPEERGGRDTQVFALDTDTYHIRRVLHRGQSPGWLHKHKAALQADGGAIEIRGGEARLEKNGKEDWRTNFDVFLFDTQTCTWTRATDHSSWRQFRLRFEANFDEADMANRMRWYTGEILDELGYPAQPVEQPDFEDEEPSRDSVRRFDVEGVTLSVEDRYNELRVVFEGVLAPALVNELLSKLKGLLLSTNRNVTEIIEC